MMRPSHVDAYKILALLLLVTVGADAQSRYARADAAPGAMVYSSTSIADGLPANVDAVKLDAAGHFFGQPGATVSIRQVNPKATDQIMTYGPSFGPRDVRFRTNLAPGTYELGLQVPDGFFASYASCLNCKGNEPPKYIPYGPYDWRKIIFVVTGASRYHFDIRYTAAIGSPSQLPSNQTLTCNVTGLPDPAPWTEEVLLHGSTMGVRLGLNTRFGGTAVKLDLINPAFPQSPLNVIDARSAAGGAWQSSFGIGDQAEDRLYHFNQADGNSAFMWGFGGTYTASPEQGILQSDWSPLFSNDYKAPLSILGTSHQGSPCYHTGIRLADGQMRFHTKLLSVGNGSVVHLGDEYAVRPFKTEQWKWLMVDQGMYLDRAVARTGDLRVYVAIDKAVSEAVRPYDKFSAPTTGLWRSSICPTSADCLLASKPISYAVLVWKVHGEDIAMAVHLGEANRKYYGYVRLRDALFCTGQDRCGNIQFHGRFVDSAIDPTMQKGFTAGKIESYGLDYEVGTPDQLAKLGYSIVPTAVSQVPPAIVPSAAMVRPAVVPSAAMVRPAVVPSAGAARPDLIRDQAYGTDPLERLDLCFPQDRAAVTTLVVAIHGGGLYAGDKGMLTPRSCGWFTPHGIMVAVVDYRLATGGVTGAWPQPLADVQLAVRWLRLHTADYGVKIDRICAVGASSGGHLTMFLATLNKPVPSDVASQLPGVSSGVDCAVDEWGPVDYTNPSPFMRKQIRMLFPGAPAAELTADARAISPILLVHRGMGPVLIEQGISDPTVPMSQSTALLAALQAHGVAARMTTYVGGHGPPTADWDRMGEQEVVPFILNGH